MWGCSRSRSKILHKNYKHQILDLGKTQNLIKWVKKIKRDSSSSIDILIINAAYYVRRLNYFENEKNIIKTISTNLTSSILITKKISELMIKKNQGMIVFFSSSAVIVKDIGTSTYSSSKAGLEVFANILNKELKKFYIKTFIFRINFVKTRLSKDLHKTEVKKLLNKFKSNIFSSSNKVYSKILYLYKNKKKTKKILISDKIR